jgi:hypothetical protein
MGVLAFTRIARLLTLHVDIGRAQRVGLDKVAPRLDLIAHEHGEDAIGFDGIFDLYTQ